jgi:hypothetical protein
MCLKFKEEIINPSTLVSLIIDDFRIAFELFLFDSDIIGKACSVLDFLISFLKKFEERKVHNMLFDALPSPWLDLSWVQVSQTMELLGTRSTLPALSTKRDRKSC